MKKLAFMLIVPAALIMACNKQDTVTNPATTSQTSDIVVPKNSAYSYTIDAPLTDVSVDVAAAHGSQSKLALVPTTTMTSYSYKPDSNFVGLDSVIILSDHHHCGDHGHGHGRGGEYEGGHGCQHHGNGGNHPQGGTCEHRRHVVRFKVCEAGH